MRWSQVTIKYWRPLAVLSIPLVLLPLAINSSNESKCGYAVLVMSLLWALQPIHLAVTALIPIFLLPALGLMESGRVCEHYLQESNVVFLGSLIIALSIQSSNLHRRAALRMLTWVGTELQWLLLGCMLTTMFLAVWIINTASAAMMLPILDALCDELFSSSLPPTESDLEETLKKPLQDSSVNASSEFIEISEISTSQGDSSSPPSIRPNNSSNSVLDKNLPPPPTSEAQKERRQKLEDVRSLFYLSIAYSATIGGTSTLTSNGPNLVLKFIMDSEFTSNRERPPLDYANWLIFCLPATISTVLLVWFLFKVLYIRDIHLRNTSKVKEVIRKRLVDMGPLTFHQWASMATFILLILLWLLRDPMFMRGWVRLFPTATPPGDGSVAIAIVFLLFIIPPRPLDLNSSERGLLDWLHVQKTIPWGILLMRGGGFALATAVKTSGLSTLLSGTLMDCMGDGLPVSAIIIILAILSSIFTELISNSAAATIILPVAAQLAIDLGLNPLALMVPVTLACSYAFVLPVGTPANALVFEHARLRPTFMIGPGLLTKFIAISVMIINVHLLGNPIFNLSSFPKWAQVYLVDHNA